MPSWRDWLRRMGRKVHIVRKSVVDPGVPDPGTASVSATLGGLTLRATEQPAGGTIFFSWNADSTAVQTPSVTGSISGDPLRTLLGVSDSGRTCMRLQILGNNQGQMGLEPGTVTLGSAFGHTFYYRWWMRIDPAFKWASADKKMKANRVGNTAGTAEFHTTYLHSSRVELSPISELPAYYLRCPYDFDPVTNPAVSSWHEYIIELKQMSALGAGDGYMKLYVDGVKVSEDLNKNFYGSEASGTWTERWGSFMVRPIPQLNATASDGGFIYCDDFTLTDYFHSTV